MIGRLANVIYWICSAAAIMCLLAAAAAAIAGYAGVNETRMSASDAVFLASSFAGTGLLVWLLGRATRYILAGV